MQDSSFSDTPIAIQAFPPVAKKGMGTTGITLDNVVFSGVQHAISDTNQKVWLSGSVGNVDTFSLGPLFVNSATGEFSLGKTSSTPRIGSLTAPTAEHFPKQPYFRRSKPQYAGTGRAVVQMKLYCKGMLTSVLF